MKKLLTILSIVWVLYLGFNTVQAQDNTLGEIRIFAGNFAPRGWALCEGQILPINENQALFSLLGTTYGGDGRTTFALPDLRGRAPMHAGNGPGLTPRSLGEKGGAVYNILTIPQMPSHSHTASFNVSTLAGIVTMISQTAMLATRNDAYSSNTTPNEYLGSVTSSNVGNNSAVPNIQPYLGLNYIICLSGNFPSRN
tara:strand:+ start:13050 stop:13640 length:591 start_codon:yes stop_codon:yes gene_type:complete